jgi:S-adenosylmethionine-diacylglycerol 3-amino-3-carboxypropyl transferase
MSGLYDRFFKATHGSRLIYNTCWEDPRADRAMLGVDQQARVAMITSAGCNALDYLLDDPIEIHAIDLNSRQNALLELKIVAISNLEFAEFFQLFGRGNFVDFAKLYQGRLRPQLSLEAQQFWDQHGHYFNPKGTRRSLYFRGASGDVAWSFGRGLRLLRPKLHEMLLELLESESLAEQRARYACLEPEIFGPVMRWLVRQPLLLSLLGVPRAQRDLIERQFEGGVSAYVRQKLKFVFTETRLSENYFWRVYLTGQYTPECCPNYLKPEHFDTLKARVQRIKLHTCSVENFLIAHPRHISHFVLLDHQDWMASHMPAALNSEWRYIFERATTGAKVLLRSAAMTVDFLPEFVSQNVRVNQVLAQRWQQQDRVGTYGCTWLAEIQATPIAFTAPQTLLAGAAA